MTAVNFLTASSVTRQCLYRGQPGTSVGTVYTVSSGQNVRVKSVVLCNTSGSAATVTLHSVASGGTAGATNKVLAGLSVAAGETVDWDCVLDLADGDFLAALQGTSGAITVTISGEVVAS